MSGDYSRFTFKEEKRYTSLLMQQGRVQLDSDWNEEARINERSRQVRIMDSLGPNVVPKLSTPDAFKITVIDQLKSGCQGTESFFVFVR